MRLIVSTDLQYLRLYYNKPELQQIAIALLFSETKKFFQNLTESTFDCIHDIVLWLERRFFTCPSWVKRT
ncbi:hypothetical protein AZZ64_004728 [Enterobacter cloacae]|nr:hypothetical protein AZZ64_004728 [Enterobacter cloacae]